MYRESVKNYEPLFGSWKIGELLGEGSFGEVYKLYREDFGEVYESALKIITVPRTKGEIKSALSDGMDEESVTTYFYGMVEEIVQEIALMSKIKGYTNIVNYEDHMVIPHTDGIGWDILIRMELLTPLVEYSTTHEWSQREVLKLGMDICSALEVCQAEDIIHRDIKPENIFINKNGEFKLGDFGIAKMMEKTVSAMSQKGTYSYMAPEIYLGQEYGFSVDIYSLGLVMYRFLNYNRLPFYPDYPKQITFGDKELALNKRMKGERIPPLKGVSEKLNLLVQNMISYHPDERIQSPKEVRQEIENILDMTDEKNTINGSAPVSTVGELSRTQDFDEEKTLALAGKLEDEEKTVALFSMDNDKTVYMEPDNHLSEKKYKIAKASNKKAIYRFVGLGIIGMCILLIAAGVISKREIPVSNYVAMQYADAKEAAENDGFFLKVKKKVYSDEFEEGVIVSQEYKARTKKKRGTVINVTLSKGKGASVGSYVGNQLEQVKKMAEEEGLHIEVTKEEYSDEYEEGVVISQNKKADRKVAVGSTVEVIVSKGASLIAVPDVVGKSREEAVQLLEENGFLVNIEEAYSSEVSNGNVSLQSIEAGTKTASGTRLTITVSKGQEASIPKTQNNTTSNEVSQSTPPIDEAPTETNIPNETNEPSDSETSEEDDMELEFEIE